MAQGEQFADGEGIAVLLPDDLIDDRDPLLGTMIDVYAEHGGVVIGLIDVPRDEISKYGSVRLTDDSDEDADVVAIVELVEKPPAETAPSTLAIIGRYILPPEIFDALRETEPGAKDEIQLTDAMQQLAHSRRPRPRRGVPRPALRHRQRARLHEIDRPARRATPRHRSGVQRVAAGVCDLILTTKD